MEHITLSKQELDCVADAVMEKNPDASYEAHREKGHKLAWACETSSDNSGKREQKVFARWVDEKTGAPVRSGNVVSIIMPPGPIHRAYIGGDDMMRYEQPGDTTHQRIVFATRENTSSPERFERWFKAQSELLEFLNEDRCRFLASNKDHEMLSDNHRSLIGTPKLASQLIDALNDEDNISQRRAETPKRKIFTSNALNGNSYRSGDEELLSALDDSGKLVSFFKAQNGERKVQLLNIAWPDGTYLGPEDYGKFHTDGAIGCLTFDIYRLHCRLKKGKPEQHSVVWAATGLQLVTNGTPSGGGSRSFSVLDVLKSSKAPEKTSVSEDAVDVVKDDGSSDISSAIEMRRKRKQQTPKQNMKRIKSSAVVFDDE